MFSFILFFAENYTPPIPKTSKSHWYHGTLNREEAVNILNNYCKNNGLNCSDGAFLVRYSNKNGIAYVLTMLYENVSYNFIIKKEVRGMEFYIFFNYETAFAVNFFLTFIERQIIY